MLLNYMEYFCPVLQSSISCRNTSSFNWRMTLEKKDLVLRKLITIRVSLHLGPLGKRSKEMYVYVLIHLYTHVYKYFCMQHLYLCWAKYKPILVSPTLILYHILALSCRLSVTFYHNSEKPGVYHLPPIYIFSSSVYLIVQFQDISIISESLTHTPGETTLPTRLQSI